MIGSIYRALFVFTCCLAAGYSQETVIVARDADDWAYYQSLDSSNVQFDPALQDRDFYTTWLRQALGAYPGAAVYDGPDFITGAKAPFYFGEIPGLTGGTELVKPTGGSGKVVWFVKVIDGGATGYSNLNLNVQADKAARIYLNGHSMGTRNRLEQNGLVDYWSNFATTRNGDETLYPVLEDSWWGVLPGPNLLAVALYQHPESEESLGFALELTGTPGIDGFQRTLVEHITSTSAVVKWWTPEPEALTLRYGDFSYQEIDIRVTDPVARNLHVFTISDLEPNQRYYLQFYDKDGAFINRGGSNFLTPLDDVEIMSFDSSGWFYHQSLDEEGNEFDPAMLDADFDLTWYDQDLGEYDGVANYDGPAFTPGGTLPIQYGGAPELIPGTELELPNSGTRYATWFLKEVDGGEHGFHNLGFDVIGHPGYRMYLNGDLISSVNMPNSSADDWSLLALNDVEVQWSGRSYAPFRSNLALRPGPNLIAVSVHQDLPTNDRLAFQMSLRGIHGVPSDPYVGVKFVNENSAFIQWVTESPDETMVDHYGATTDDFIQRIEIEGERQVHVVEIPNVDRFESNKAHVVVPPGSIYLPTGEGDFLTSRKVILQPFADGWSYFQSLGLEAEEVDPRIADADFFATWMLQSADNVAIGGGYDGPAFTANQTAPFEYGDVALIPSQTKLETPLAGSRKMTWFVKEVDGGEFGYGRLLLEGFFQGGAKIYLNGAFVHSTRIPFASGEDVWNEPASGLPVSKYFETRALEESVFLAPGKNILAVSLHQPDPEVDDHGFQIRLSGVEGIPEFSAPRLSELGRADVQIGWVTAEKEKFQLRYGPGPFSMESVLVENAPSALHQFILDDLYAGQIYFYEILDQDGAFLEPRVVGDFYGPELAGASDLTEFTIENITSATATIKWTSAQSGNTTVRIGTQEEGVIEIITIEENVTEHLVELEYLQQGTNYWVEVETANGDGFRSIVAKRFETTGFRRVPYLQLVSHEQATIKWRTQDPDHSVVYYGTDANSLDRVAGGFDILNTEHSVTIGDLQPDTRYYYLTVLEARSSRESPPVSDGTSFFQTAPLPNSVKPIRIWAIGDSGTANADARSVYQSYLDFNGAPRADVWLMLGDNAYNFGGDWEYQRAVFDMYPEMLRTTPLWPTMGNHDGYTPAVYYDIFSLPKNGEAGGIPSGTESYYSFDHGNVHFVCLNSEEYSHGGPMDDWLQMDLEATTADWIIAYFHHGPYTKGSHNSDSEIKHIEIRANFLGLLESYGVDLILSGHSHQYERSMLLNGHYEKSNLFSEAAHGVDTGNGSTIGSVDEMGQWIYNGGDGAYAKMLGVPNAGQVSITAGASGKVYSWWNGSIGDAPANPHPVMVNSLSVLGSLVIDVNGLTLDAQYLSSTGELRDHFQINKKVSLAVEDDFDTETGTSTRFIVRKNGNPEREVTFDYTLTGGALSLGGFPVMTSGTATIPAYQESIEIEVIVPTDGAGDTELSLTITDVATTSSVNGDYYVVGESGYSNSVMLANSPIQRWWLEHFGPVVSPDWERDDDGDNLKAMTEYAYALDPTVATPEMIPVSHQVMEGEIEFIFVVNNDRPELEFEIVESTDLKNLSPIVQSVTLAGLANPQGMELYRAKIPIDAGKKFFQLRIRRR